MESVRVREELDAPIDQVWEAVQDFGDVRAWAPEAKVLGVEGQGLGAVRRIETPGGVFVESCESHEPAAHRFSYKILESPAPFRDYVAVVQLESLDGDRCAIEWSCTFEAPSGAEGMREVVENTYRGGFIASLRKSLAG
jgi:hypothetical protein